MTRMIITEKAEILRDDAVTTQLASGITSCLADADRPAHYDRIAWGYDLLISSALYYRPAWGAWPSCHAEAARMALADCPSGPILDAGCGSLLFTADVYRAVGRTDMICLDRSLGMLRRAQRRMPAGQFWHGSALELPFRDGVFGTTLCWGTVHVLGTPSGLLAELRRVTRPGGQVAISTLVRSKRAAGEFMLKMLHRRKELARPETEEEVCASFQRHMHMHATRRVGDFLFLTGRVD